MFGIEHFGLFVASSLLLNIAPGADTIYILGRSISQGRKAGVLSVLGIVSGAMIHTMLAAFGLSLILEKSVVAFNIVKYLGAAYLIFMGIKTIRHASGSLALARTEQLKYSRIYLQGMLTNLLNPKVALFYLTFLPQFINSTLTRQGFHHL